MQFPQNPFLPSFSNLYSKMNPCLPYQWQNPHSLASSNQLILSQLPEMYRSPLYQMMYEKMAQQMKVMRFSIDPMNFFSGYQNDANFMKWLQESSYVTFLKETNGAKLNNTSEAQKDAIKISNSPTTTESVPICITKQESEEKMIKREDDSFSRSLLIEKNENKDLVPEECIKKMLSFFVKNIGTMRRTNLEKEGEKIHQNDPELKEIFHGLLKKMLSSKKTKEEKIKYVVRKCFKFMKDKLLEENGYTFDSSEDYTEKLNSDKVEKMFFKHYFSEKCGKNKKFLTKNEVSFIKDLSMPFRYSFKRDFFLILF